MRARTLALGALAATCAAAPPAAAQGAVAAVPAPAVPNVAATAPAVAGAAGTLPGAVLAVRAADGGWRDWWSSDAAPADWRRRPAALAATVRWRPASAPGVEYGELALRGSGEAWRTRLVVVRLDPRRVTLRLDTAFAARGRPAWTIERAPAAAALAVNAGQFVASMPWGWMVLDGRTFLDPQHGPLSAAVVVDSSGRVRWVPGGDVATAARAGGARWAFQSYPALLDGGRVPTPLQAPGRGVDLSHRDARAAIGLDAAGRLVVALTRFDGVAGLGFVPLGLTTPEMAAVMGALGCEDAMMLDGGISAQLRVRDAGGTAHSWPGLRRVPVALVALPAPAAR
jgi:hypothetical protein